jgi:hypothetical protein
MSSDSGTYRRFVVPSSGRRVTALAIAGLSGFAGGILASAVGLKTAQAMLIVVALTAGISSLWSP